MSFLVLKLYVCIEFLQPFDGYQSIIYYLTNLSRVSGVQCMHFFTF